MPTDEYQQLAPRAARALQPALPYFKAFGDAMQRVWSPSDTLGNIILTVAENKLSTDMLQTRLEEMGRIPKDVFCYPAGMCGTADFKQAVAGLMERTFAKGVSIDPEHLLVSAGAGAVLDTLFYCICSPGEGVLIPAPYYPAFDNDLQVKNEAKPLPVYLDFERDVAGQLEAAAVEAQARGHPVRALLLANPNNPMGTVYKRWEVLEMLRWCLKRGVHLISDEIYALSIFGEGAVHSSALQIAEEEGAQLEGAERLGHLLHTVWGLSKDLCASGLRVGVLHTRHPQLISAYHNLGYFVSPSGQVMWALQQVLADDTWMDSYIMENSRRLKHSYDTLAGALTEAGVPFTACDSAMFCFIDLRAALVAGSAGGGGGSTPSWEDERVLWDKLVVEYRLLLTPGESCHAPAPGYFRVCYAWMPAECLPEAARRIKLLLASTPMEPPS